MMAAGKPEQGAARGGPDRPQEQRTAPGANEKSKPQDAPGAQGGYGPGGYGPGGYGPGGYGPGGYGPGGWWGGPGGYGMPPFGPPGWGMPPGMPPSGMYGYGGPQGGPQPNQYDPNCPPASPWPWSWFMPWLGPWLGPWMSWLSSWFVWPGFSWMQGLPPFLAFAPPPGGASGSTLHYAQIRAEFWRHWFATWAQISQQAAADCYVPNPAQPRAVPRVDTEQLLSALKDFPEDQKALVLHAVHVLQAWDGLRAQPRAGADW